MNFIFMVVYILIAYSTFKEAVRHMKDGKRLAAVFIFIMAFSLVVLPSLILFK